MNFVYLSIYLTVSESDPHCDDGGVGGRQGLFNNAAKVEFWTATVASVDCFVANVDIVDADDNDDDGGDNDPEVEILLLPTRIEFSAADVVDDGLYNKELPAVIEPFDVNCSSRSMSSVARMI